jgi:hypothetical protein
MKSKGAHELRYKHKPNDEFYTPKALAQSLISLVPLYARESILDAAAANPVFYDHFPCSGPRYSTTHFETWDTPVDWIVTNPPYSLLKDWWMPQTYKYAQIGFAYLLGQSNLTTKRIAEANAAGFGLTKLHMFKVMTWYGISYFAVFEKGKPNIVTYDRKIWYEEPEAQ